MIESKIIQEYGKNKLEFMELERLEQEAEIALHLIKQYAFLATNHDREDSSGHMMSKMMPVEEVVSRSFQIAALFMLEARSKGLVHRLPSLNKIRIAPKLEKIELEMDTVEKGIDVKNGLIKTKIIPCKGSWFWPSGSR